MIKFTDVCKAYLRYWYVILICMVLVFGLVFAVVSHDDTYTAESTIKVDKNATVPSNEFISQAYAESVIKEMDMRIKHEYFATAVIDKIAESDAKFAAELTPEGVSRGLSVSHRKDTQFFVLSFNHIDENKAKTIVDVASDLIIAECDKMEGSKAKLVKIYYTEVNVSQSRNLVYAVIGLLIGLVLGIVLVTFFVVFNPFVEDKDLLAKETGLPVLADLEKVRGEKDETRQNN